MNLHGIIIWFKVLSAQSKSNLHNWRNGGCVVAHQTRILFLTHPIYSTLLRKFATLKSDSKVSALNWNIGAVSGSWIIFLSLWYCFEAQIECGFNLEDLWSYMVSNLIWSLVCLIQVESLRLKQWRLCYGSSNAYTFFDSPDIFHPFTKICHIKVWFKSLH